MYKENVTHIRHMFYCDIKDYKINPAQKLINLPPPKIPVISNLPQKNTCRFP